MAFRSLLQLAPPGARSPSLPPGRPMSAASNDMCPGELVHSVSAEQSVLGSILADPAQWARVSPLVAESDFYRPDHRHIWRAMATLQNNGKVSDVVTVLEHLTRGNELDEAGGF